MLSRAGPVLIPGRILSVSCIGMGGVSAQVMIACPPEPFWQSSRIALGRRARFGERIDRITSRFAEALAGLAALAGATDRTRCGIAGLAFPRRITGIRGADLHFCHALEMPDKGLRKSATSCDAVYDRLELLAGKRSTTADLNRAAAVC